MRRALAKLLIVVTFALGALIGTSTAANAGEWCWRVGFPTPVPDVKFCVPTN